MIFYDQHCHSSLSFDSEANPFDYIQAGTQVLVLTDHLDLENPYTGQDDIPNFKQLLTWKEDMARDYGVTLLLGVEIGYVPGQEAQIREILAPYPFDLKLLSCHHNRRDDYMDKQSADTPQERVDQYVDQLLQAVSQMTEANVMTHFDYGFRIHDLQGKDLDRYKDKFIAIFEQIIKHDIAFELNTKSISKYHNAALYEWGIPLYQSVGGQLFSLGSDCHVTQDLMQDFPKLKSMLTKYGVKEVALYQGGKLQQMPIGELPF